MGGPYVRLEAFEDLTESNRARLFIHDLVEDNGYVAADPL